MFALNEYSRFAFRSPLFKLNPLNSLLLLFVPSIVARYFVDEDVNGRIKNAWRIHKNREAKGLEATVQKDGFYTDKMNELYINEHGLQTNTREAFRGDKILNHFDNPFVKFNKDFAEYPEFHDEHDLLDMYMEADEFERDKPF